MDRAEQRPRRSSRLSRCQQCGLDGARDTMHGCLQRRVLGCWPAPVLIVPIVPSTPPYRPVPSSHRPRRHSSTPPSPTASGSTGSGHSPEDGMEVDADAVLPLGSPMKISPARPRRPSPYLNPRVQGGRIVDFRVRVRINTTSASNGTTLTVIPEVLELTPELTISFHAEDPRVDSNDD